MSFLSLLHYPSPRTTTLASLVKGEVLSPERIRATTGGIATPLLPKPHYSLLCTNTLASLVKGRWIDGKAQTVALLHFYLRYIRLFDLSNFSPSRRRDCLITISHLHQPSQTHTIPLAFRRVSVCVCLVGFASLQSPWAHTLKASLPCLFLPKHHCNYKKQFKRNPM